MAPWPYTALEQSRPLAAHGVCDLLDRILEVALLQGVRCHQGPRLAGNIACSFSIRPEVMPEVSAFGGKVGGRHSSRIRFYVFFENPTNVTTFFEVAFINT